MPVRDSYTHGTPSWIDLSTSDPAAAREFYGTIFGWEFDAQPTDQGGEYIMALKGGKSAAGMMQQAPEQAEMGVPPMWNTYVTVTDVDSTVAKVEPAGGSVMAPPMQVMDAGRMAVVVDPTGAVLCLWQAENHPGAQVINEHGALTWSECQTPDVDGAAKFYAELFGWGTDEMDMGDMGTYTVFMLGADGVAGGMNPPMEGVPPHWSTVFAVDDTDGCVDAARAAGATIIVEPIDIPVGRQAVIADPQGAVFGVIKLADPDAA
ncbi:MAG: VOC family protein [Acidimicrobiales bacterium]